MKCNVGVSNRHVHLSKDVWGKLFGSEEIEVRNYLNQPGQFASCSTVDIMVNGRVLEHLRVVGPLRDYNQIEISMSDAEILGVVPPRRQSGDLEGSLGVCLIGPKGKLYLVEGLILADCHVHLDRDNANKIGLNNYEVVGIYKDDIKIMDARVKITDDAFVELHIDRDEENLYDLHNGDIVEFRKY